MVEGVLTLEFINQTAKNDFKIRDCEDLDGVEAIVRVGEVNDQPGISLTDFLARQVNKLLMGRQEDSQVITIT